MTVFINHCYCLGMESQPVVDYHKDN